MARRRALLVIDVQHDFLPGGSLAVPDGNAVVPLINDLLATYAFDLVVLSQDWHTPDHVSFAANNPGAAHFSSVELPGVGPQVMWPTHCVQGSAGARLSDALRYPLQSAVIVRKGTDARVDSYSAFGDAQCGAREKTQLERTLRDAGVTDVYVAGLALDYCVAYTCRDAARLGFATHCLAYACRGIQPESVAAERAAMAAAGVRLIDSAAAAADELLGDDDNGRGRRQLPPGVTNSMQEGVGEGGTRAASLVASASSGRSGGGDG